VSLKFIFIPSLIKFKANYNCTTRVNKGKAKANEVNEYSINIFEELSRLCNINCGNLSDRSVCGIRFEQ
jgi:hypothetical protein